MKKGIILLLVISILINIFLLYRFFAGSTAELKEDTRTEMTISNTNRDFVMAEMRTFLEAVQHIQEGLRTNDYSRIEKNAANSGLSVAAVSSGELFRTLPVPFKTLGADTHTRFDKIAQLARQNAKKEQINEELSGVLNNCTSCHRTYKLSAKEWQIQ